MAMEFDGTSTTAERAKTAPATVTDIRPKRAGKSATAAAKTEALAKNVEFEFDGKNYTLDPMEEWDIEFFEMLAEGQLWTAVKVLLGDNQYTELKTDADGVKVKRTMKDLSRLIETATSQVGVAQGE